MAISKVAHFASDVKARSTVGIFSASGFGHGKKSLLSRSDESMVN
jgi:hypothetical protein